MHMDYYLVREFLFFIYQPIKTGLVAKHAIYKWDITSGSRNISPERTCSYSIIGATRMYRQQVSMTVVVFT